MEDDGRKYLDIFLWVVLGIIAGAAIFVIFSNPEAGPAEPAAQAPPTWQNTTPVEEPGQPYSSVSAILLTHGGCPKCNSSHYLLSQLQEFAPLYMLNVSSVREVAFDSEEGSRIIEEYGIGAIPTIVLSREASANATFQQIWESSVGTVEGDGSFVFRALYPPYFNTTEGRIHGVVTAFQIDADSCSECMDLTPYLDYMAGSSVMVEFGSRTRLNESDPQAQELISRYGITKLPTFIFDSEISVYPLYAEQLSYMLEEQEDGWFVLNKQVPPYVDLSKNRSIEGKVRAVKLVDGNCTGCFDPEYLVSSLKDSVGIYVSEVAAYDISDPAGSELVTRYNITKVPTILLSPEASAYSGFGEVWASGGDTIESDGWFVFRNHEAGQLAYRNLSSENSTGG